MRKLVEELTKEVAGKLKLPPPPINFITKDLFLDIARANPVTQFFANALDDFEKDYPNFIGAASGSILFSVEIAEEKLKPFDIVSIKAYLKHAIAHEIFHIHYGEMDEDEEVNAELFAFRVVEREAYLKIHEALWKNIIERVATDAREDV